MFPTPVFAASNGAHYGAEITRKVPTMVPYWRPQNDRQTYRTVSNGIKTSLGPFVRHTPKKREKPRGIRGFRLHNQRPGQYLLTPEIQAEGTGVGPSTGKPVFDFESAVDVT